VRCFQVTEHLVYVEKMTSSERAFILKNLEDGRDSFLRSIAGLSEAQLHFKPQPDRWSIAECIEHIVLAEDTMYVRATNGAVNPNGLALDPEKDERFTAAVVARRRKVVAPEAVRPAGRFTSTEEACRQFLEHRERAIAYARECSEDVRHLFAVHPLLGEIDCYQFLLLLAVHPARHAAQIEEIKSDPAFPKA
jgi:DinB superfamily